MGKNDGRNQSSGHMFAAGAIDDGSTSGDGVCCYFESGNTIIQLMNTAGISWTAYAENAGSSGSCSFSPPRGGDHFGFIDFSVNNVASICSHFLTDSSGSDNAMLANLNSASPSRFIWMTPTDNNNGHDTGVAGGDSYLRNIVPKILSSTEFTTTNAALLILYDEGYNQCPNTAGTGECVYAVFAGPAAKKGIQISPAGASHYTWLSTIEKAWGLGTINGNDAGAPDALAAFGSSGPLPLSASISGPNAVITGTSNTWSASVSGGTPSYTYSWSFGDGGTSPSQSISHTYTISGTYTISLTVKDSSATQQSSTSQMTVIVSKSICTTLCVVTASFTQSVSGGTALLVATASGGIPPYTYVWNFGDNSVGNGISVTHIFTQSGNYSVTLTVSDSASPTPNVSQSNQSVSISSSGFSSIYLPWIIAGFAIFGAFVMFSRKSKAKRRSVAF